MNILRAPLWLLGIVALIGGAAFVVTVAAARGPRGDGEHSFMAENRVAMARMMADMDILPSGDPDRDFAGMMIAHHRGAIEMARIELAFGHDERLRRIAQGIVVEQQQEIEAMRLLVRPAAPVASGAMCGRRPAHASGPILAQRALRGDVISDTP